MTNGTDTYDPFTIVRPDTLAAEPSAEAPARDGVPGRIPNGVFTLIGPKSHRTVKVKTVLDGPLKGKRILYVMTGPDNVHDYTGVAFVEDDDTVNVWKKMKGTEYAKVAFVFTKMILDAPLGADDPRTLTDLGYRMEAAKNCISCNTRIVSNQDVCDRCFK